MATKMELSLDDIIKTNNPVTERRGGGRGGPRRGGRRGGAARRGSFGGGGGGGRRDGGGYSGGAGGRFRSERDDLWAHQYRGRGMGARAAIVPGGGGSRKIIISNLHYEVSDADIIDLFGGVGQLKYASVHYDRSGRSMGKADVVYVRKSDAQLAIDEYNGVPLDGRRMMITYSNATPVTVVEGSRASRQADRILRYPRGIPRHGRGGGAYGRIRRGRGGGRGGENRGANAPTPTVAELDAEMDAYVSANAK